MNKKKKVIPIAVGAALLLTIIPSSFSNAKGSITSKLTDNTVENSQIKIEKLDKKDSGNKVSKTLIKGENDKNEVTLTINEIEEKARDILEEFLKINITNEEAIKTEEIDNGIYLTTARNNGSDIKIKINKKGFVINVDSDFKEDNISKNYKLDVDKSKELVEKFLEKHASHLISNIDLTLTKNSNSQNNILEYKIQRVHNNVKVVEEGGSIIVDGEKMKIISFNSNWSSIDFEEELGRKLNKKDAINILRESSDFKPNYINNGTKYKLNFNLNPGEEYIINVNKREIKNIFKDEYTVKGNVVGKIKSLNSEVKTEEEAEKVSVDIVKAITGKTGKVKSTKTIKENGKSIIRSIIETESKEKYYVEYDSKTFKVLNIYKYGYDTLEKSSFNPIEFKEAYKKAVVSIGLIYNKELKSLNLNQKEYELNKSRVYSFTFNRLHNKLNVEDQSIGVNIDALTGEVLSVFLDWNNKSTFDDSGKKDIEKASEKYLSNLKGEYVYINENGIGKLYYILREKSQ